MAHMDFGSYAASSPRSQSHESNKEKEKEILHEETQGQTLNPLLELVEAAPESYLCNVRFLFEHHAAACTVIVVECKLHIKFTLL